MTRRLAFLFLVTALFLGSGCDFGQPTGGGGTGVEGLTGTLVDPQGTAATGALVRVYPVVNGSLGHAKQALTPMADSAIVDGAGHFAIRTVIRGTYTLVATWKKNDTAFALHLANLSVQTNTDIGTQILQPTGTFILELRAGVEPVAGALCRVPSTPFQAVSDSTGHCILTDMSPGNFRIEVSGPGLATTLTDSVTVYPGMTSGLRLQINIEKGSRPAAPQLHSPAPAGAVSPGDSLRWSVVNGATAYELQITAETDTAFATPLVQQTVSPATAHPVETGTPGASYRWRVRSLNGTEAGEWSSVQTYTLFATLPLAHFALTPSTLALWTFDSTDGQGRFSDLSGRGRHLDRPDAAVLSPSPYGRSVSFNDDRITTIDSTLMLSGNERLTYEVRLWLDTYPSSALWNQSASVIGQYAGLRLLIDSQGRICAAGQVGDGTSWLWYAPKTVPNTVPLGQWVDIAVSGVRGTAELYAYVNGSPVQLYSDYQGIGQLRALDAESYPFAIGDDTRDYQPFPGRIDEIRISNDLVLGKGPALIIGPMP